MKHFISRRDRIILSAIDIINELSVQGLSTKELAFRQQVNESALYRHFKSKDAIIEGVIEYFSQYDTAIYNSAIKKELNPKAKIIEYAKAYLEYYESYPAITAILFSYESLSHDPIMKIKMNEIFNYRLTSVISLIEEGQNQNDISRLFSSRELAIILFGYCDRVIQQWRMSDFKSTIKEDTITVISKLLLV